MAFQGGGRGGSGRPAALAAAAVVCLTGLAACGSTQTAASLPNAAALGIPTGKPLDLPTSVPMGGYHVPLLRCTKAQEAAAAGPALTVRMISGQTIHATAGERIDLMQGSAGMRPEAGKVEIRAGRKRVCQSGGIQGKFPRQILPLIITGPGHIEVSVNTRPIPPGVDGLAIFYIDSAKAG